MCAPSARTHGRSNRIVRRTRTNCGLIVCAQSSCWSGALSISVRSSTGRAYLGDRGADRELRALELDVDDAGDATDERECGGVLGRGESGDLGEPGQARVGDQLAGERGADAAMLVAVRDGEGDLGAAAGGACEPGDRRRLRVAL